MEGRRRPRPSAPLAPPVISWPRAARPPTCADRLGDKARQRGDLHTRLSGRLGVHLCRGCERTGDPELRRPERESLGLAHRHLDDGPPPTVTATSNDGLTGTSSVTYSVEAPPTVIGIGPGAATSSEGLRSTSPAPTSVPPPPSTSGPPGPRVHLFGHLVFSQLPGRHRWSHSDRDRDHPGGGLAYQPG